MHLLPPAANVDLYNQGFDDGDLFNRVEIGKRISRIVESIDDPLVIAIDGNWGSGKSYFLKCWVGAHRIHNDGAAITVYFDAFRSDYLDDPLIALTSAISDRLPPESSEYTKWKRAKSAAAKIMRPLLRIGTAVGTAGASEIAGPVLGAMIDAGSEEVEAQVDAFWRAQEARTNAMISFRDTLSEITDVDTEGQANRKIVIVIDELDRCRPDYALSVLETIKHFFSHAGVHFILGINSEEFANIVRQRYGIQTNPHEYLRKFVNLAIKLPESTPNGGTESDNRKIYFDKIGISMGIDKGFLAETGRQLDLILKNHSASIRSIQNILSYMVLVQIPDGGFRRFSRGYRIAISGLAIMKSILPEEFAKIKQKSLSIEDISRIYGIDMDPPQLERSKEGVLCAVWRVFLGVESSRVTEMQAHIFEGSGPENGPEALKRLVVGTIDLLELPENGSAA